MLHSAILLQLGNNRNNVNRKAMSVISAMERVMRNTNAITDNIYMNQQTSCTSHKDKTSDARRKQKKSLDDKSGYKCNYFLTPALHVFASTQNDEAKKQLQETSLQEIKTDKDVNLDTQSKHSIINKDCSQNFTKIEETCWKKNLLTHNTIKMQSERINEEYEEKYEESYKSPFSQQEHEQEWHEHTDVVHDAVKKFNPPLQTSIVTKVSHAVNYPAVLHQARELLKLLHTQAYQEDASHSQFVALLHELHRQGCRNKCKVNQSTMMSNYIHREWQAGIATQLNLAQSSSSSSSSSSGSRSRYVRGFVHEVNDVQLNEVCSDGRVVSLTEVELPCEFTNEIINTRSNMRRRRETLGNALLLLLFQKQQKWSSTPKENINSNKMNGNGFINVVNVLSSESDSDKNDIINKNLWEKSKSLCQIIHRDECKVYLHFVLYKEGVTLHEALQSLVATVDDTNLIYINDFVFNTRLHNDNFVINTNYYNNGDVDVDRSIETSCVTVQVCSVAVKLAQLFEWYVHHHNNTSLTRNNDNEENLESVQHANTCNYRSEDNTKNIEFTLDACEEFVQQLLRVNTSMEKCVIQPIRWSLTPFASWTHNEPTLLESYLSSPSLPSSSETKVQYSVLLRGLTRHVNHLESIAQAAASCVPNFFSTSSFGPISCPFRSYHVEMALSDGCYAEAMIMLLCVELWTELVGQETRTQYANVKGNNNNNSPLYMSNSLLGKWHCDALTLLKDNNRRLGSLKAWWSETFPTLQTNLQYSYNNSVSALMWNVLLSCRIADCNSSSSFVVSRKNRTHFTEKQNNSSSNKINGCGINKENFSIGPLRTGDFASYYSYHQEEEEHEEQRKLTDSNIKTHEVEKSKERFSVKYVQCDEDGWQYTVHDLLLPLCESSLSIFSPPRYHNYECNTRSGANYSNCPVYQKLFLALKQQQKQQPVVFHGTNKNYSFTLAEQSWTLSAPQTHIKNTKAVDKRQRSNANTKDITHKLENANSPPRVYFRRAFVTCTGFPRTERPWVKEFTEPVSVMTSPLQTTHNVQVNNNNNTFNKNNEATTYSLCTDLDLALRNSNANTQEVFATQQRTHASAVKQILYPFSSRGRAITERLPSGMISAAVADTSSFANSQLLYTTNTSNGQYHRYCMRQKVSSQQSKCLALHFTLPSECSWHNYIREVCFVENGIGAYRSNMITSSTQHRVLEETKLTNRSNADTNNVNSCANNELCESKLSNTQYNELHDSQQVDGNLLSLANKKRR